MALTTSGWRTCLPFFQSNLFKDVQNAALFEDSKTFADAIVLSDWQNVISQYEQQKNNEGFSLSSFVETYFNIPDMVASSTDLTFSAVPDYVQHMWDVLTRTPDAENIDSLISLSRPYIVPGGRFREIYYWDSYFTALGLIDSGKANMAVNMLENFLDILDEVGCIPNGNRAYYYTRSQPPVLALMFALVEKKLTNTQRQRAIAGIEKEYAFWMNGANNLSSAQAVSHACDHLVRMPNGALLNRYYDSEASPRPESYREDIETAELVGAKSVEFYRHIRAACESGWDFSSRWLADESALCSIRTTEIVPIDLNALLYFVESTLARVSTKASKYREAAVNRKQAINTYLWNEDKACFYDYHYPSNTQTTVLSAAATVPLFVELATDAQAVGVNVALQTHLLAPGGIVTTANTTTQQWDSPNGWAPLQWFAVKGLLNYGFSDEASDIINRFTQTIEDHFARTGVMLEKYNVCEPDKTASGGEYEVQLGFGWTNGVYTRFKTMQGE
ncbi:alpha,alpha-trehalase TreF [uncultured Alteromonas sp.]|uniref:alpha,alpha-trehalase TreF n=1 Tax=uncultured Alteromonas sp. TaxID=179113 RepID=UPI0030CDB1ED|tara:strand:- start:415 stop:1923 length:1509 start_codon:yes stop_codon:yes gene_type:complete